ncbi:Peroxidase [Mycena venus]|uniref:Peroxidase n=1 Tax=Mycena venus TaxID=2733690 RepID=A0A8H6X3K0_9AGAR|nr:Peroxidase [Mycena venus]
MNIATTAYIWSSPQLDALESLRFEQAFADLIQPCDSFSFDSGDAGSRSGRSNAADWIRAAYHDMATHNIADGTGGMDASIRFDEEQARPENAGDGFQNTLLAILARSNRYLSIADVLALGAVFAFDNWQTRTSLPLLGKGFTQAEMIGLVACGNTFGGVQHAPFPDIVSELNDPNNTQSVAHFDATSVQFDNKLATEYIFGTTQNPLVVGLNETTNSDKRIFASNGNATMRSFAQSPELFSSTCEELMALMIDTVPKGVQLTEVITPLSVKLSGLDLILAGDVLQFSGQVRVRKTAVPFWNITDDPARTVRLLWDDHIGGIHNATLRFTHVTSSSGGRNTATWYTFSPADDIPFLSLDPEAGITTMCFAVDDKLEDQGGVGFAMQDDVLFSSSSCFYADGNGGRWDIAVRKGVAPVRVYLEVQARDSVSRPIVLETNVSVPVSQGATNAIAPYAIRRVEVKGNFESFKTYNVGAEVGGVKATRVGQHSLSEFSPCV